MKKVIKSYEKMDANLLALLAKQYPEGINPGIIITFQDHTGKRFKGVELLDEAAETVYLIKLDEMLRSTFTESEEKEETDEEYDREETPDSDNDDDGFEDSFSDPLED